MYEIHEVTGVNGGECFLLTTGDSAALFDSGYDFSAPLCEQNIRAILGDRPLGTIFLTHSHYDHATGSAYFKTVWPEVRVIASPHAKKILEKQRAHMLMRELNAAAAKDRGYCAQPDFIDRLQVDCAAEDGARIAVGALEFEVIAAPGHTKCSVCYYCKEQDLLIGCETLGVIGQYPQVLPCYIIGYEMTMRSLEKISALRPNTIVIPHFGVVEGRAAQDYLDRGKAAAQEAQELILSDHRKGMSDAEIVAHFAKTYYVGDLVYAQPKRAFMLNAEFLIPRVLEEHAAKNAL